MKVSFDFDSTINIPAIEEFASTLIDRGVEVWIVTSRFDDVNITESHPSWMKAFQQPGTNDDVRETAKRLNIPSNRVIYTNMELKSTFLHGKGFIWHLDDDWVEIKEINDNTDVIGITQVGNKSWREDCMKLL